jgi:large subunit ribosomal protein L16
VEFLERPKLRFMEKVPQYPPNLKPPKMQKRLMLMRGPEKIHDFLLHKQFGIQATGGGRMRWGHFEMLRLSIGRKMDVSRMFAFWRVDAPWQPLTKQGQGQRMGGGKGSVDKYVTPVRSGRIIMELGGKCEFAEVKDFLQLYANQLPFNARAVSHEMLEQEKLKEKEQEELNVNPYTLKYVIQNNLSGCHRWLSPVDHKWFGKHL